MKRLFPFILLIALVLGGALAVPFLLSSEKHRPALESWLAVRMGHPVLINRLTIRVIPPRLVLEGVSVRKSPTVADIVLQAEKVEVGLSLGALMRAKIAPANVALDQWQATVLRTADGRWDPPVTRTALASVGGIAPGTMHSVTFKNGTVTLRDGEADSAISLLALSGQWNAQPGTLALKGKLLGGTTTPMELELQSKGAGLATGKDWTGQASLRDGERQLRMDLTATEAGFTGRGTSPEWSWSHTWPLLRTAGRLQGELAQGPEVYLKELKSEFQHQGATWTFVSEAKVEEGTMRLQGSIASGPEGTRLRTSVALQKAPSRMIPNAQSLASASAVATGLADFEVRLSTPTQLVRGHGVVEINNGMFKFPEPALQSVRKSKTLAYFRAKFPSMDEQGVAFQSLRIGGFAEGPLFQLTEGQAKATDVKVGLAGMVDLSKNGMDLFVRINLKEKDDVLIRMIPGRYVSGAPGQEIVRPIYGRLQGTPDEWHIRSTTAARIPPAAVTQLSAASR